MYKFLLDLLPRRQTSRAERQKREAALVREGKRQERRHKMEYAVFLKSSAGVVLAKYLPPAGPCSSELSSSASPLVASVKEVDNAFDYLLFHYFVAQLPYERRDELLALSRHCFSGISPECIGDAEALKSAALDGRERLQQVLPARLLQMLVQRLQHLCSDDALCTRDEFLFWRGALLALCALMEANPQAYATALIAFGIDLCLLAIARQIVGTLVGPLRLSPSLSQMIRMSSSVSAAVSDAGDDGRGETARQHHKSVSSEEAEAPKNDPPTQREAIYTLQPLLRLLSLLHSTTVPVVSHVTGLSNAHLAEGNPCRYRVADTLGSERGGMSDSDTRVATALVLSQVAQVLAPLLLFFSKDILSAELRGIAEADECCAVDCMCTVALLEIDCLSKEVASWVKVLASYAVSASSVLMARLVCELEDHKRHALLRQVTCGLFLITALLRDFPVVMAETMGTAGFFENLVSALRTIGARYTCATTGAASAVSHDTSRLGLSTLASITSLQSAENRSEPLPHLEEPRIDALAEDGAVDELLHVYLGLLAANEQAQVFGQAHADEFSSANLNQLESTVIDIFPAAPPPQPTSARQQMPPDDPSRAAPTPAEPPQDTTGSASASTALCSSSCLYDLVVKRALLTFSLWMRGCEASGKLERARMREFRRLVLLGLYRVVLYDEQYASAFRLDVRLEYAVVYMLYLVLTRSTGGEGRQTTADNCVDSGGDGRSSVIDEVEAIFTVYTNFIQKSHAEEADSAASVLVAYLGAVLVCGLRGPNATAVLAAMITSGGFTTAAAVASWLAMQASVSGTSPSEKKTDEAAQSNEVIRTTGSDCLSTPDVHHPERDDEHLTALFSASSVLACLMRLLEEFLRDPSAQTYVLEHQPSLLPTLLTRTSFRTQVEPMIVTLLCYRGTPESAYPARMSVFVQFLWDRISEGVGLVDDAAIAAPQFAAGVVVAMDTELVRDGEDNGARAVKQDLVLLSLLRCVRMATHRLSRGEYHLRWGPLRALQNVLCGPPDPRECFMRLIHRASLPWRAVSAAEGLTALLGTVTCLVRGNPVLRGHLLQTIQPDVLVDTLVREWLSAYPGDWLGIVRLFLPFIYEAGDDAAHETCEEEAAGTQQAREAESTAEQPPSPAAPQKMSSCGTIQNAPVLVALLQCFARGGHCARRREALQLLLSHTTCSIRASWSSLFTTSNAGVSDALAQLIPVLHGDALLDDVLNLLVLIASHHIGVLQVKHLFMNAIHAGVEERKHLVPILVAVLSAAASACMQHQAEPQSCIALQTGGGPVGVKAPLQEFPLDGYSIAMWVRPENPSQRDVPGCIVSIQTAGRRTVLSVMVNADPPGSLSVCFQDEEGNSTATSLGTQQLLPLAWTHLTIVHRPAQFFSSASEFQLLLNGTVAATVHDVVYPRLTRGFLYLGTRGEELERCSFASSYAGQLTAVYFFNYSLSAKDIPELVSGSKSTTEAGSLECRVGGIGVEKRLAERAILSVDPRLGEKGHLYNFSALLRGGSRDSRLITYEGTLVCNASSIVDAFCVLGALPTVVIPLLALLVSVQLPFSTRTLTGSSTVSSSYLTHEKLGDAALCNVLKLIESLSHVYVVRASMIESSLFAHLASVLRQLGPLVSIEVPQILMRICEVLLPHESLFEAAYTALFLAGDLLLACNPPVQLIWINQQHLIVTLDPEVRFRIRELGAQQFVVNELLHGIRDRSDHAQLMRTQLLDLLDALTVDPITMGDAIPLLNLVSGASLVCHRDCEGALVEVLRRTRLLICSRSDLLSQFLGRKDYAALLVPLVMSPSKPVRHEALLQLILLITRSRRTQELINPVLITTNDVTHVSRDVSLSWLRSLLERSAIDLQTFVTLRCALTGEFDVRRIPESYTPVTPTRTIRFAPVLAPMLMLLKHHQDAALKVRVLADLVGLLTHDPLAWRSLVSVSGWYALVADICVSERHRREASVDSGGSGLPQIPRLVLDDSPRADVCSSGDAGNHGEESHGSTYDDSDDNQVKQYAAQLAQATTARARTSERTTKPIVGNAVFAACVSILSITVFEALQQENYGAVELNLLLTYLRAKNAKYLQSQVLCAVAKRFAELLPRKALSGSSASLGLGGAVALSNFVAFVYAVENVLFYDAPLRRVPLVLAPPGPGRRLSPPQSPVASKNQKVSYTEWKELSLTNCTPTTATSSSAAAAARDTSTTSASSPVAAGCPAGAAAADVAGASSSGSDTTDRQWLMRSPDGHWLHLHLALTMAHLLTTSAAVLNYDGGIVAAGGAVDFAAPAGTRHRKGGLVRLFGRFFRVACTMTLRDPSALTALVLLLDRYVRLVDTGSPVLLFFKRAANMGSYREHPSFVTTMILIHSVHDLLVRRIRVGEYGGTHRYPNVNEELVERLKSLVVLFGGTFQQLRLFNPHRPPHDNGDVYTTMSTFEWLCDRRQGHGHVVESFVEVASRPDYNALIEHCVLMLEHGQQMDKTMAKAILTDSQYSLQQLQYVLTGANAARLTVLENLKSFIESRGCSLDSSSSVCDAPKTAVSFDDECNPNFPPASIVAPAATVSAAVQAAAWSRFIEGTRGTIWNLDPAGLHKYRYVRLSQYEQQQLARRKIVFDKDGTSHANVTQASDGASVGGSREANPTERSRRLRLRGGEGVLLENKNEDAEEDALCDNTDSDAANDDQTPTSDWDGSSTHLISEEDSAEHATPVVLSLPCEVPYMMHCWSATITIRGADVCVIFDEHNVAYNQQIAEDAMPFRITPKSYSFSATKIFYIAPGRRFRMRRTGIEIWLRDRRSFFLNFADTTSMHAALQKMCQIASRQHKLSHLAPLYVYQENPRKEPLRLRCMGRWRDGEMTNFDYLLWLNLLAGRSVNDITQYPVFPWVLADYTSSDLDLSKPETFRDLRLPIGACGPEERRLAVHARYEEMKGLGDVPSHYFTHYSSAAVTIYFLVRLEPYTTLQILLQGGHFDHADRMFNSMASCYRVVTSSQDVRELIPELYYLPELCSNANRVQFGRKQDGTAMDHLQLPPWAHNSPYEFIYRMREALECDYVSSMLHHWIDLIFGCKQRGKEAIESLNMFNWHSYEELDKNRGDSVDQRLLIDSLDNIGQTPVQVFRRRHCARRPRELEDPLKCGMSVKMVSVRWWCSRLALTSLLTADKLVLVSGAGAAMSMKLTINRIKVKQASHTPCASTRTPPRTTPRRRVSPPLGSLEPSAAASDGAPHHARIRAGGGASAGGRSIFEEHSFDLSEVYDRRLAPIPPGMIPNTTAFADGPCTLENTAVLMFSGEVFVVLGGVYDSSVVIRHLSGTIDDVHLREHRGRVVRIAASSDSHYLVTGAEDTTFMVWSCGMLYGRLQAELHFTVYGHEANPTAADVCSGLDLLATASMDGVLMLHSLSSGSLDRTVHHPAKYSVDRVLIQAQCYVPNLLFASNMDQVVHQVSVNGVLLRSFTPPGRVTSWTTTPNQHIILSCVPHNMAAPQTAMQVTGSDESVEVNTVAVVYLHSFFLNPLRTVALPIKSTVTTIACHPRNPQVVIAGTADGYLALLRTSRQ